MDFKDYYKTLGMAPSASEEEVRKDKRGQIPINQNTPVLF